MDLVVSSANQLAAAIRDRRVSAAEVLDAHLKRIDERNPSLNAIVTIDADAARDRARQADEARARGITWGPLHGVPFTLKDAFATAGMRTTVGFPPLDHVPREDSTVAARLKAAGGVLVGKTNVAELLADFQTNNSIFGRTNNPWDLARTPGGSSGGAAAAVASGMTAFDVGTDLSGSIRIPAHFCGVFGFKPTEHRVSLAGVVPDPHNAPRTVRIMSCVGPIARSIDDLAMVYSILAGPDPRDTDIPPVPIGEVPRVALRGLRIAVAPSLGALPLAADIRSAIDKLARQLGDSGVVVDQPALPIASLAEDLSRTGALIGMMLGAAQPDHKKPARLADYMAALQQRDASIAAWDAFFDQWDALLCAPSMTSAFPHCEPGSPLAVDGASVDYWTVSAHSAAFNYSGNPAVVLPCGLDRTRLPVGVQLVGKRWEDSRLLGIAGAVAEFTGAFQPPT
jgi:amidase